MLDFDPAGAVHVLYPYDQTELQPLAPGVSRVIGGKYRVLWPFGTETLKLFAFDHKPVGLEAIMGKQDLDPGSPLFVTLEKMVGIRSRASSSASARLDTAQTVLRITSYARKDMQRN